MRKHDFTRSESENWRLSRDEQNGEDEEGGGWRLAGSRRENERWCPPSPGGRLHMANLLLFNYSLISVVLHLMCHAKDVSMAIYGAFYSSC